jgi:hypothetical protein
MPDDDVTAAAERLSNSDPESELPASPADNAAAWRLARWALPLLDPTPISEQLLVDAGGWRDEVSIGLGAGRVGITYFPAMPNIKAWGRISGELPGDMTVGQLRLLCRALGIPLSEPAHDT